MGFLFVKSKKIDTKPSYTGLQIQTSSSALPIPIVFGTAKVAPNIIWHNNFKTIKKEEKTGGKGGTVTSVSYEYTSDLMLGLCEGPISQIGTVWVDKATTTVTEEGWTVFLGTDPQDVWPYMLTAFPAEAMSYNGLAYLAAANFPLGAAASVGNHNFELTARLANTASANNKDANPALVVQQFLNDKQFGTYFPQAFVDTYTLLGGSGSPSYECYCNAMGLAFSPVLNSQESAASILERWLLITNTTVVWSDGLLKFIPFTEENVTGHGYTWIARTAPVYDLTDADFVDKNDDPVKITRMDVGSAQNVLRFEITDRNNEYNIVPVECRDEAMIQLYGRHVGSTVTAHEICEGSIASLSGQLVLQRGLYIRNLYKFSLSWEYCLLEPMDVVTLTDVRLGLMQRPVRIVTITETDDGVLDIEAEDLIAGLGQPTNYPKQGVSNNPVDMNVPAVDVNPPMIFEPPTSLTNGAQQVWIGASGINGDLNWGGCDVWVSTDNISYQQIGTVVGRANQGVLKADLQDYTGSNPDTANTLEVDLTQSAGALQSTSPLDASTGVTRSVVGNELLSYEVATLTATSEYDLTNLYRGQDTTEAAFHAAGSQFCRIDDNIAKIDLPAAYIGLQLYVKFVSFNVFGRGYQDLSMLTPYVFTPTGSAHGRDALLNRLASGQPTDLGDLATTEQATDLGNIVGGTAQPVNLGGL